MATIGELREKYPQYQDMSDTEFANAFHKKYYSDIPLDDFYKKLGMHDYQAEALNEAVPQRGFLDRATENFINRLESGARSLPDFYQGFDTNIERLTHGILQPFLKNNEGFKDVVRRREEEYQKSKANSPIATEIGGLAGAIASTLPFAGGGVSAVGKIAPNASALTRNVIGSALGGGLAGGAQYVGEDESRLENAALGAGIGAAIPLAGAGISKAAAPIKRGAKKLFGDKELIAQDIFKKMLPEDISQAMSNKMAANRLGVNITPGEASGSPILAEYESKLGTNLKNQKELLKYKRGRQAKEKEAIEGTLNRVAPSNKIVSEDIRETAQEIIKNKKGIRQAKAKPFYESSENVEISPNKLNSLLKNKTISNSYSKVLNDPDYDAALRGFKPTSVKALDLVKRHLGDREATALGKKSNYRASLIKGAREKLTEALDKASKDYKKARGIFSKESPAIEKIENSVMGKIANLKDTQLRTLGAQIFNPKETDISVLRNVRDEISKVDPDLWKNFVRNEMERRLVTKGVQKTGAHGSNFYNQILEDEALFKQFKEALKGDRKTIQNLNDMRKVFKDLANKRTFKGQYGKGETSMTDKRNLSDAMMALSKKMFGGKYDKAAIEIITGNEWDKYLRAAASAKGDPKKYNDLAKALEEAAKAAAISKSTQTKEVPHLGTISFKDM